MASTVTRGMSVVYGSTTIGGTADVELDGPVNFDHAYGRVVVSFTAVVYGTTDALFAANCIALENAFRTPRQRLQLLIGSSTWRDYNPATNSGFDQEPSITRGEGSARMRFYECSVLVYLPADLSGENGLVWINVETHYKPNNARVFHVWGTYTALSSNSATAQYAASAATLIATYLPAGSWNKVSETTKYGRTNKILDFDAIYDEIISAESASGTDDSDIKSARINFVKKVSPILDADLTVEKPITATVSYEAILIAGVDPVTKWTGNLRAWLFAQLESLLGGKVTKILEENVSYETQQNTISATLSVAGYPGGGTIAFSFSQSLERTFGAVTVPMWTKDRNPFARYVTGGVQSMTRKRMQSYTIVASNKAGGAPTGIVGRFGAASIPKHMRGFTWFDRIPWDDVDAGVHLSGNWLLEGAGFAATPLVQGLSGDPGNQVEVWEVTEVVSESYVVPVNIDQDGGGEGGEGGGYTRYDV